jgi:DHA3 family tetracycline resistance protein-like MFS transporter
MSQTIDIRTRPAAAAGPARSRRVRGRGDFLLLWSGQTVSKIGNGAYKVALAWSVYRIAGSTADMGLVLALNLVPELGLVLFGGAVADRFPRRAVVIAADGAAGLVTLGLAVAAAASGLTVPMLMAAAFLLGVTSAFYGPAYAAMKGDLVGAAGARTANAWIGVSGNLARVAGPAVAGIAFAFGGAGVVFGFDAATFALAVGATLLIRTRAPRPAVAQEASFRREVAEGVAYTAKTGWLMLLLAVSLIANFACLAPYAVLLPALVEGHGDGVSLLGLLNAAEIAAAIVGAIVIGRLGSRLPAGVAMLVLAALLGTGTLTLGLSSGRPAALVAGVLLIGAGLSFDVIEQTLMQALVPRRLLSRVYAVNTAVSYSLLPAGYALAGFTARQTGSATVLAAGGAVLAATCLLAAPLPAVRRMNRAEC